MDTLIKDANKKIYIEEMKIMNGDHSNRQTVIYFASLANYYACGGQTKLPDKMKRVLGINWFTTDKAKYNYIINAENLILGGIIYIKLKRLIVSKNISAITVENSVKILKSLETTLKKWNIELKIREREKQLFIRNKISGKIGGPINFRDLCSGDFKINLANKIVDVNNNKNIRLEKIYFEVLDSLAVYQNR